jgi:hypothetical protein
MKPASGSTAAPPPAGPPAAIACSPPTPWLSPPPALCTAQRAVKPAAPRRRLLRRPPSTRTSKYSAHNTRNTTRRNARMSNLSQDGCPRRSDRSLLRRSGPSAPALPSEYAAPSQMPRCRSCLSSRTLVVMLIQQKPALRSQPLSKVWRNKNNARYWHMYSPGIGSIAHGPMPYLAAWRRWHTV